MTESYSLYDRELNLSRIQLLDQRVIVLLTEPNIIETANIVIETLVVRNEERTSTYQEGIDYLIHTLGLQTEIVIPAGSPILEGEILSVDYEYLVNPAISFTTESTAATSNLSLLNNRLSLQARLGRSEQRLQSGEEEIVSLENSWFYSLGFGMDLKPYSFGGSYAYTETSRAIDSATEGFWRYTKTFEESQVSLYLRDVYRSYRGEWDTNNNTFSSTGSYRRNLARGVILSTVLEYLHVSGEDRERQNLSLEAEVTARLGRSNLAFLIAEEWQDFGGTQQRDDRVRITLRRNF